MPGAFSDTGRHYAIPGALLANFCRRDPAAEGKHRRIYERLRQPAFDRLQIPCIEKRLSCIKNNRMLQATPPVAVAGNNPIFTGEYT
jgi:hypothetical protein